MAITRFNSPFAPQQSFGTSNVANMMNLAQAGSFQLAPALGNIASNTPYVGRNLIPFLLEAPRFFRYTSNAAYLVRCLKALVETHARTIEGLTQQIQVDYAESPWGGSGERIQTATNVTRSPSNPNFGLWELQGRAVQKFIKWWITYGIADENTKYPRIVSDGVVQAQHYDQTFAGMSMMFIEPDPTMTDVVQAYLCTNMQPTGTGPWDARKDVSQIGQNLDLNIEFTAITDISDGVILYARELLAGLNRGGMNPNETRTWIEKATADVRAADTGLAKQLEQGAANRIVV
jgi:hypothetical protein